MSAPAQQLFFRRAASCAAAGSSHEASMRKNLPMKKSSTQALSARPACSSTPTLRSNVPPSSTGQTASAYRKSGEPKRPTMPRAPIGFTKLLAKYTATSAGSSAACTSFQQPAPRMVAETCVEVKHSHSRTVTAVASGRSDGPRTAQAAAHMTDRAALSQATSRISPRRLDCPRRRARRPSKKSRPEDRSQQLTKRGGEAAADATAATSNARRT
mmetsp:Transcript_7386/g.15347  ORF Transcript_7386/g.15347 Transcript_7386/m.15347 type:complete len:214 (+) Transcript_7386:182-823(+)